jgi:hypothetical protein
VSRLQQAITKEYVAKDSFIYEFLHNLAHNVSKVPCGFRYSEPLIQFCLLVKFHSGKRTLDLLRGNQKDGYNFHIPSEKTIRNYLPTVELNKGLDSKLKEFTQGKSKCKDLILSYDEIEIRSGLIYHEYSNRVVGLVQNEGTEDIANISPEKIEENQIASKIIQFFLCLCDGSLMIPVLHYGHDESKNGHVKQVTDTFHTIQQKLDRLSDGELKIKAIASDRYDGNFEVGRQLRKNNVLKVDDFWHLLKSLRNAILKPVFIHDVKFGLYLFREIKNSSRYGQFNIHENFYAPEDKMDTSIFNQLLDEKLISILLEEEREEILYLGKYLQFMTEFRFLFTNINDDISKKLSVIQRLLRTINEWFDGFVFDEFCEDERLRFSDCFNHNLFRDIVTTLNSIRTLLSQARGYKVNTCVISSNCVENYFSVIRSKNRYVNMEQYETISRYADIAFRNRFYGNSIYSYNHRFTSKSYSLAKTSTEYKPLSFQNPKKRKSRSPTQAQKEKGEQINQQFKPRKRTALVRDIHSKSKTTGDSITEVLKQKKNSVEVVCPYSNSCKRSIPFKNHASFKRHVEQAHSVEKETAKTLLYQEILNTLQTPQSTQSRQNQQELSPSQDLVRSFSTNRNEKEKPISEEERKEVNDFKSKNTPIFLKTLHAGQNHGFKLLEIGALSLEDFSLQSSFSEKVNPETRELTLKITLVVIFDINRKL